MHVLVSDPSRVDDLARYLEAHEYLVVRRESGVLEARPINPITERADRERLTRDVEAWRAWHPGIDAALLG